MSEVRDHLHRLGLEIQAASDFMALVIESASAEDEGDRSAAAQLAEERRREIFGDSLEEGIAAIRSYRMMVGRRVARNRAELEIVRAELGGQVERDEQLLDAIDHEVGRLMDTVGKVRIDHELVVVSRPLNPPKVALDPLIEEAPDLLPEEFQRVKIEPDKAKINKALRAGKKISGCSLAPRTRRTEWR